MNDLLDELHARAALDILKADNGINLYEGVVPKGFTLPYTLAYTDVRWPGAGEGQSFDATTSTCVTRWNLHNVGGTEKAARAIAGRARGLLVNVRPAIAGRSCCLIQQDPAGLPPQVDQTTGKPVFDIVDVYVLTTFAG